MKKKVILKKILLFTLLFLLPFISINAATIDSNNNAYEEVNTKTTVVKHTKSSIENSLVEEARTYIKSLYPGCPDIIPSYIVKAGLANNIDICFMLAQTQLETTFGKAGVGRTCSRRSLFGIEKRYYKTYKEAINAYVDVLTSNYLVMGRTEQHLLNNYVNKSGHRYAGNPKYEYHLKKHYNTIATTTKIKQLQRQYKRL